MSSLLIEPTLTAVTNTAISTPALGTLSCLPLEIRHLLWEEILRRTLHPATKKRMCAKCRDRYVIDMHNPGYNFLVPMTYDGQIRTYKSSLGPEVEAIRRASLQLHTEFDAFLVATCTFAFDAPWALIEFLERLWTVQRPHVRRLHISLSRLEGSDDQEWITYFASLPPNLTTVTFAFSYAYPAKRTQRISDLLRRLTTQVRTHAPRATVRFEGTNIHLASAERLASFRAILDAVKL